MHRTICLLAASLPALLTGKASAAPGGVNANAIVINDNANASLYPSTITVTGPLPITNINVRLKGLQHPRPSDLSVMLVSPSGRKIQLMAGTNAIASGSPDLNFHEPGETLNGPVISDFVNFRPTVIGAPVPMDAPAPGLPYETSFASLFGEEASGTWSLYVRDNVSGVAGTIADGWSIGFNGAATTPFLSEFTYQGALTSAGVPVNGTRDIRLTFWTSPYSTFGGDSRGSTTALDVPVINGRFTMKLPLEGTYLEDPAQMFVEVAVREPGQSDFTTLVGRQQITASPYALFAKSAEFATFAESVLSVPWTSITGVPGNVANPFNPWQSVGGTNVQNTNTGNLLIGTSTGTAKLTVAGTIHSTTGGVRFPDGTTQTTAASTSAVVARTTHSVDIASLAANTQSIQTVTISGVSLLEDDVVVVSPDADFPVGLMIAYARVLSGSQVRFVVANFNTAAVNPPPATYAIKVIR